MSDDIQTDHDVITIVTTHNGTPASKTFTREYSNSEVTKESACVAYGTAVTKRVRDIKELGEIIQQVSENPCQAIILGGFKGIPCNEEFEILPEKDYLERGDNPNEPFFIDATGKKYTSRLKRNTIPSSYKVLDRDIPPDMTDVFANLSRAEWLECMNSVIPGFKDCAKIIVSSSSGRVIVDGERKHSENFRVYYKVKDPGDHLRFRDAICAN